MIGQTVSHYRIVSQLGAGGMGVVYRADDLRLGRPVALKFLPPDREITPQAAERLRREARAASSLNHPNICTIHDIDEHEGHHFIVMELVEGETLSARIGGRGLPTLEALSLAIDMADALAAAHARGIVHRDLKPSNVLVTRDSRVKVLDFGLAKLEDSSAEVTMQAPLTSPGSTLGTIHYMSPEQARGDTVDARSDIFSFGLILYEMLTGQAAFSGGTSAVIYDAILNRDVPRVRTAASGVPPELDELVARIISKRPENRPQRASQLADHLRALKQSLESGSSKHAASKAMPSVAVLPFKDLSPASDQQYFCEGMADEIITALSGLGGIQVASRTSAVRAQEKGLEIAEIGERLHVQHVVEGSVRKAGNRVRITAQLVNVADGYQLWTERYDRDMDDVFAVQDDIARTIVERLRVKLTAQDDRPLVRKGTDNAEAYELYLKGRYHWARRNRWHLRAALECFQKAVALDPDYALPYTGLADCYTVMCIYGVRPGRELVPPGIQAAERALALDPDLAEAHHAYGAAVQWMKDDFSGAERAFARALGLNPSLAITHAYLSLMYTILGRFDEGRASALRAVEVEPDSPIINYIAGGCHYWIRDFVSSERLTRHALELEPEAAFPRWVNAMQLWNRGHADEALRGLQQAVAVGDRQPLLVSMLGFLHARIGRHADAEAILAEMRQRSTQEYMAPFWIATVCLGLGRQDETFALLEQAYDERNGWIQSIGVDAVYDELREHPRFTALLRKIGLPG